MQRTMNIKGHEVPQYLIENYLRACEYNRSSGTEESDRMQKTVHQELIECAGLNKDDDGYADFCLTIDLLVSDLLLKGY